jgi:hypothetical protein
MIEVNFRSTMQRAPHSPHKASPGWRAFSKRSGAMWVLLLMAIGSGCTSSSPSISSNYTPQHAVVIVENHTDWPWRIAFNREDSSTTPSSENVSIDLPWVTLAPREVRRIDLAGGVYRVRRELISPQTDTQIETLPAAEAESEVRLWLVAGRSYTWPLATLFSTEEGSQ